MEKLKNELPTRYKVKAMYSGHTITFHVDGNDLVTAFNDALKKANETYREAFQLRHDPLDVKVSIEKEVMFNA